MSQFPGGYIDPYSQAALEPPRTSGLAVTALVFSLIFCCPITTLVGPLLGLIAFVTIGSNPAKKGKGLAVAAIIIGVLLTIGWVIAGVWVGDKYTLFMQTVTTAPTTAFKAGFAGDTAGFKAQFHGAGAAATDEEVQAFIAEVRNRYGAFVSGTIDENNQAQPAFGKPIVPLAYTFIFDKGAESGQIEIAIMDEKTQQWVWKLNGITIRDATLGDLTFPPGGTSSGSSRMRGRGTPPTPPPPPPTGTATGADSAPGDGG